MINSPNRDLDMSDVLADAENMRDQYLCHLWLELEPLSTPDLEQARYTFGHIAREEKRDFAIVTLRMIDQILLSRLVTTLCEGCLGRTGCDICNPPVFMDWVLG